MSRLIWCNPFLVSNELKAFVIIYVLRHSLTWSFMKHGMGSEVPEFKHRLKHGNFAQKSPSTLILERNVADNWRERKQQFQLYMEASGSKKKIYIFLHISSEKHWQFTTHSRYRPPIKSLTSYSKNVKSIAIRGGTSHLNITNSLLVFRSRPRASFST